MKKLNKLCAILIAVLGVQTLSAQTDVTSTYLTNAGFDDESGWITSNVGNNTVSAVPEWKGASTGDTWFYGGAVGYGSALTVNSVTPPATNPDGVAEGGALGLSAGWGCTVIYTQEVTLPAGVYTLTYKAYNANTGATQANNYIGFTTSSTSYYGATTSFAASTWVEESVNFVLTAETTGNISVGMGAISGGSGANAKLFVDGVTLTYKPITDVTEADPVDLTSWVSNTQAAWTGASELATYDGISMPAVWKGSNWAGDALSQTINGLPAGNYDLEVYCQAHSAWISDVAEEGATGYTYLKANEYQLDVPIRNADSAGTKLLHTFDNISITNGTLTITVYNEQLGANWLSVYVKSLTYLGPDKSIEEANFTTNITALNALTTNDVPTAFVTKIDNLKSTYGSADASSMTLSELTAANGEIKAVVDLHPSMVAAYANLDIYEDIYNYSTENEAGAKATYKTALDQAKADAANAVTVDAINAVIPALEAARQVYVVKADPTNDTYFDYTFLMNDPAVANGDGWTDARTNSGQQYTGAPDNTYLDSWNGAGQNIYQELAGLPSGLYTLKAAGRASTSCTSAYIYLNDTQVEIDKAGNSGNDLGNGWKWYTTEKTAVAGTAKVGFGCNSASSQWAGADDFHLYYYGFDVETVQNSVASLKAEAEALVGKPMNADVASALDEAISGADATKTTRSELEPMITALNAAIANAETSVTDYSKLKKYIDMTAVFTTVTEYQTKYDNGEYTADDVDPIRKELNVLRFNAASVIFTNNVEVTGWTGTMGGKNTSGQHWDGTSTTTYYDNNSWGGESHSTQTSIELPAGTYVLKAALRSHASTTLTLTVQGNVVNVEGKGDAGYGIDTSGTANFADEGTYANEDKGRGWEWEFVKFELNETTEVTLSVECDYNDVYGWASFSDISLWMDDATYVTVYSDALVAPLAEARALVNTKPMGEAENTALVDAIALGEGSISTPDELNAAVEALETAVANANTWIATYNTTKAPLVASLERFEYGFNDGAEGRQIPLTDETWNTLLEAVEAAATAKDVTNSYDGFESATSSFNQTMDWATNKDFSMANQLDCTNFIGNADCTSNDAWTGTGRSLLSGEHWSGDASRTYFAQNFDPGEARTQVVSLPYSGWYYLRVSVRAVNAESYCTIIIDGVEYTVNGAHGSVGGTIATDGTEWPSVAKGIAAGKSFANVNKGYGWVYKYIPFKIENATKDVTIKIALSNYQQSRQAYCGGMDLFYTGKNCYVKEGREVVHHGDYTDAGSFEAFHTTHNVTAATMPAVSVTPTNPNALVIANAGQVVDGTNNVVIEGACASLSLADGKYDFDAINAFEATEVSYDRSFTADTWLTICLPFDVEIPADVKVETLSSVDLTTKTFTFDEVTGTMTANTPYLIKNSSATAQLFASVGAKSVAATTEIKSNVKATDEATDVDFCGTFTTVTSTELMEDGTYDILFFGNDGQLYYLSDGVDNADKVITFKPFRSYLRVEKGAINWSDGVAARVRHGGDATAIEDIIENEDAELVIYDLMGRRVNTMEKGRIYIVNGEKVLNK